MWAVLVRMVSTIALVFSVERTTAWVNKIRFLFDEVVQVYWTFMAIQAHRRKMGGVCLIESKYARIC